MPNYISLLRGINVSGQKIIKMEVLRKMFEYLDFSNVSTYLQSGNVVFHSTITDTRHLSEMISNEINRSFGFEVQVFILSEEAWRKIAEENPFAKDIEKDISALYVTFLSDDAPENALDKLSRWMTNGEEAFIHQKTVYLYYPNGYGKTKLSNNEIERALKCIATTRNWKTTLSLLSMIQDKES
jgi:uncharacterized protein (DUF1697 family)